MKVKVLVAVALLAYLASGLYFVGPDEQGVVCRFGAIVGKPRPPGLTRSTAGYSPYPSLAT